MACCKGTNQDTSKCNRKAKRNEEFCWQHCGQLLDPENVAVVPKRVFKMPVEIKIDDYNSEIKDLLVDVEFISKKLAESDVTSEELSELSHKSFRMSELQKEVDALYQHKKDNFREEKQFRVLTHIKIKSDVIQGPNTERILENPGFRRAIDFEIRKLNSRQKKLDKKKTLAKDIKTVKNVEDD
jgi:hypothetical protein